MTRTCSLYFLRLICAKNPNTPSKLPLPRKTVSPSRSGNSRQGTSGARPAPAPACAIRCTRSDISGDSRGQSRHRPASVPCRESQVQIKVHRVAEPWQRGHAPNGLLKLKRRGSGSLPGTVAAFALISAAETMAFPFRIFVPWNLLEDHFTALAVGNSARQQCAHDSRRSPRSVQEHKHGSVKSSSSRDSGLKTPRSFPADKGD